MRSDGTTVPSFALRLIADDVALTHPPETGPLTQLQYWLIGLSAFERSLLGPHRSVHSVVAMSERTGGMFTVE